MTRLFAGNLSFDVTSDDLLAAFATYGPVRTASVVSDRTTGASRGFGFVEMEGQSHATAAIAALDGATLRGRNMTVSLARARGRRGDHGNPPQGWAVVGDARHRW